MARGRRNAAVVALLTQLPVFGGALKARGDRSKLSDRSALEAGDLDIVRGSGSVEHNLMICNAYAFSRPLDVFRSLLQGGEQTSKQQQEREKLTTGGPIKYKECRDFAVPLGASEQLDFKAGEVSVGTFHTSRLPPSNTTLLLVPHRRDPGNLLATFDSHAFAKMDSAQVAVIDAFRGKADGKLQIADAEGAARMRREDLRFNSVIALKAGNYEVSLASASATSTGAAALEVADGSKNVVMRVGNGDASGDNGQPFPQEVVVFTQGASTANGLVAQSDAGAIRRGECFRLASAILSASLAAAEAL